MTPGPAGVPRRSFLSSVLAVVIGGVITLVPLVAGTLFFLDPLIRRKHKSATEGDGFIPVAELDDLPEDGTPRMFTVVADKVDAWNRFPKQPIGTVYLRKVAPDQVLALNSTCPHLGCTVDFKSAGGMFFCPCHTSSFDLDGKKLNEIPPRPMDSLETKLVGNEVWVKYQDFRGAVSEKIPLS